MVNEKTTPHYEEMSLKELEEELSRLNAELERIKSAIERNESSGREEKRDGSLETKTNVRYEYEKQLSELHQRRDRINSRMNTLMIG